MLRESINALRDWQRHVLLREYGADGQVKPENIELSEHLDRVLAALPPIRPADPGPVPYRVA